jgi:NAD(P)H-quinone oxidoreductase subunit 5
MLVPESFVFPPTVFFILLACSVVSALFLLSPKVPLSFVRVHTGIISLPPLAALAALIFNKGTVISGPWRFDSLSWLLALFVLTIGLIVQRYSVRYLLGDQCYRKYFTLLTMILTADSLAWLSDDLRLMLICWGASLFGLSMVIGLKKEWYVARNASLLTLRMFALSWIVLLSALIWLMQKTGHWQLSQVLTQNSLAQLGSWEKSFINLLLIVAVMIPAAQFPFQRWLLDSVVAPTPISAVMHAGMVNAGGIMLRRFEPLFSGSSAQMILLIFASFSVLIGTGIMLVQVDYKRKLVGSTMAQMGYMLIQCALGAYWAAIIHAVLHGLFKASLFLQAGSAVHLRETITRKSQLSSFLWLIIGGVLGLLVGIGFWLTSPPDGYQLISAIILGWTVFVAWKQLVAFGSGRFGRLAGIFLFTVVAIVFYIVHSFFFRLLYETVQTKIQSPAPEAILFLVILLGASAIGTWLFRNRSKTSFAVIYLWLVRLSEPKTDLIESHPKYLTQILSRGGNLR